jgi:hypothetical protein
VAVDSACFETAIRTSASRPPLSRRRRISFRRFDARESARFGSGGVDRRLGQSASARSSKPSSLPAPNCTSSSARGGHPVMPRQPFRPRHPDAGFALGPRFMEERPQAMALVAECIAIWSEVEVQSAILLALMLGAANSKPAAAMYFALSNERAKADAMKAIAHSLYKDDQRLMFDA